MGRIVAVAGNLASGKSTLAGAVAKHHGWPHLPRTGYDTSYLEDLFRDPRRWSFEAQMAFLHHKAEAVREAMCWPTPAVLDRSLTEDVHVFAAYFRERGWMGERAHEVYMRYAGRLLDELDEPDVLVYCYAPADVCRARLAGRPRPYQALYPSDHIGRLHDLYERWWPMAAAHEKLRIDTAATDTRQPTEAERVAQRIAELLHAH